MRQISVFSIYLCSKKRISENPKVLSWGLNLFIFSMKPTGSETISDNMRQICEQLLTRVLTTYCRKIQLTSTNSKKKLKKARRRVKKKNKARHLSSELFLGCETLFVQMAIFFSSFNSFISCHSRALIAPL